MTDLKKSKNSKKIFARGSEENDPLLHTIADACRSIVFISETDADLVPFVAGEVHSRSLRSFVDELGVDEKEIEEVSFDKFFARLTAEKDWHRAIDKKRISQFVNLRSVLENNLEDIRVIREGKIRINIYIVGVAADGRLAGVKTKAIET